MQIIVCSKNAKPSKLNPPLSVSTPPMSHIPFAQRMPSDPAVTDFEEGVVAEWIATGHAESVNDEATNTVLAVHSPTVKIKAPKIGANL